MEEATLARLGQTLRRVPGARLPLEARIALRERRAVRAAERRESAWLARDRAWIASLAGRRDLRLNFGSSSEHVDGWISADIVRDPKGECMRLDATAPWPFESDSAEAVNSEHMVEHLDREAAPRYFAEAMRVLRPSGVHPDAQPRTSGDLRCLPGR